jgi:putative ABC transport system substrate-binding protein
VKRCNPVNSNGASFINLLGGAAAAWPFEARAQQPMPVVGLLLTGSLASLPVPLAGFRRGLSEAGYVEGQNVEIDYRSAEGRFDRLPELAADLARRRIAVIMASSNAGLLDRRPPLFPSCARFGI